MSMIFFRVVVASAKVALTKIAFGGSFDVVDFNVDGFVVVVI